MPSCSNCHPGVCPTPAQCSGPHPKRENDRDEPPSPRLMGLVDEEISDAVERLRDLVGPKLPESLGKPELQRLALEGVMGAGAYEILADHFAPRKDGKKYEQYTGDKALREAIPKMSQGDLARLAIAAFISVDVGNTYGKPKTLLEAAARYKVDPAKVKKAIADEEKAKSATPAFPGGGKATEANAREVIGYRETSEEAVSLANTIAEGRWPWVTDLRQLNPESREGGS